jgi:hypothetical protein
VGSDYDVQRVDPSADHPRRLDPSGDHAVAVTDPGTHHRTRYAGRRRAVVYSTVIDPAAVR